MNLDLSPRQSALIAEVRAVLDARVQAAADCEYDPALLAVLRGRGVLPVARDRNGLLDATLLTEEVSRCNGLVPAGLAAFVAPLLRGVDDAATIAIRKEGCKSPVRYAPMASLLVELGPEQARTFSLPAGTVPSLDRAYVYPVGIPPEDLGPPLQTMPAGFVRRRWQLALGAEVVGAIDGALACLVAYLSQRKQFGKALGSFQALQHRLAELSVSLECARVLVREAAWQDDDERAAVAACYAATTARATCVEAHQLSGARGFTKEFGLYRWSLRLHALSLEMGGSRIHADVAASVGRRGASAPTTSTPVHPNGLQSEVSSS